MLPDNEMKNFGVQLSASEVPIKLTEASNGVIHVFAVSSNVAHCYTQTPLSAVSGPITLNGFCSMLAIQLNAAGSGIAGLLTGANTVTRGTQTDLVSIHHIHPVDDHRTSLVNSCSLTTSSADSDECSMASVAEYRENMINKAIIDRLHREWSDIDEGDAETVSSVSLSNDQCQSQSSAVDHDSTVSTSPTVDSQRLFSRVNTSSITDNVCFSRQINTACKSPPTSNNQHLDKKFNTVSEVPANLAASKQLTSNYDGEDSAHSSQKLLCNDTTTLAMNIAYERAQVDCILLTADGQHIVTGSVQGPPQVWNIMTGDLLTVMSGDDCSSTNLHLVCHDSLLVAEVAPVAGSFSHKMSQCRQLQIWDFFSGSALEMSSGQNTVESCTTSCVFSDGGRLALARIETPSDGGGITVIIYDLVGNEPLQYLHHHCATTVTEQASFIAVSEDNQNVVVAYQKATDNMAVFTVFDLTEIDCCTSAKRLCLDATAKVSVVCHNSYIITGSQSGQLIMWDMHHASILGQLVTKHNLPAHSMHVTALDVSKNQQWLVSASADTTLKVWHLGSFSLSCTLSGHCDKVECCSFSGDGELIVSGSADGTIRVWRLLGETALAVCETGVDVHRVLISEDKQTVVAVGNRSKLIMLHLSRTRSLSRH
jgi:hypothetical protein